MTSAIDLSKLTANDDLTPVLGGYCLVFKFITHQ